MKLTDTFKKGKYVGMTLRAVINIDPDFVYNLYTYRFIKLHFNTRMKVIKAQESKQFY